MRFAKRNWGWWLVLLKGEHYKVKLLYFKKNGEISNQRHQYRNELWCWIFGQYKGLFNNFGVGKSWMLIEKNEWHHYKSKGRSLILEIQYGNACDETDIERKNG